MFYFLLGMITGVTGIILWVHLSLTEEEKDQIVQLVRKGDNE